jgi:hypothetical protein
MYVNDHYILLACTNKNTLLTNLDNCKLAYLEIGSVALLILTLWVILKQLDYLKGSSNLLICKAIHHLLIADIALDANYFRHAYFSKLLTWHMYSSGEWRCYRLNISVPPKFLRETPDPNVIVLGGYVIMMEPS